MPLLQIGLVTVHPARQHPQQEKPTVGERYCGDTMFDLVLGPPPASLAWRVMPSTNAPKHINEAVLLLRAAAGAESPERTLLLLELAASRLEVAKQTSPARRWSRGKEGSPKNNRTP